MPKRKERTPDNIPYQVRPNIRFKGGLARFVIREADQKYDGNISAFVKDLIQQKMDAKQQKKNKPKKGLG